MNIDHHQILNFWYEETQSKQWWTKDLAFDQSMTDRFFECYQAAIHGELSAWRETAEGRLAEIIVIDQFARNMFRDDARSFAHDSVALVLSQEAIAVKADQAFFDQPNKLSFLYMPLERSDSPTWLVSDSESEGRAYDNMPSNEAALHTDVQAGKRDSFCAQRVKNYSSTGCETFFT